MPKKAILNLVNMDPNKLGSFETYLITLSNKLMDKGFESIIIFQKNIPPELKSKYKGIIVDHLSRRDGLLMFYFRIIKLMLKYRPKIVHAHFYSMFSPIAPLIYFCGCHNIIFTDHSSGNNNVNGLIKKILIFVRNKFLNKCICAFIKKILCVSRYVLERDRSMYGIDPNKFILIYNGVSLERFYPHPDVVSIRRELNIPQNIFLVSTAAHLIREKGIDYLIKAAKILTDRHDNVIFLISGNGKDEGMFKILVNELGLDNKVQFLGTRSDLEKIFSISDISICPSIWHEAFGLVIAESMACGIPVIATKVGGIPEIVEDGVTGILVAPKDITAIADAVERLYTDSDIRKKMGRMSLIRIRDRFNLDFNISKTIAIYESFVS